MSSKRAGAIDVNSYVFWKTDPTNLAVVRQPRRADDGCVLIHFYGWSDRYDRWVTPRELRAATDAEVTQRKEAVLGKK